MKVTDPGVRGRRAGYGAEAWDRLRTRVRRGWADRRWLGTRARRGQPGSGWPRGADRGVATVWVAVTTAALCAVFALVLELGQAVTARHRAGSAADLAALAAADRALEGPEAACEVARRVASAQGAVLVRCAVHGEIADVVARSSLGRYAPTVRARAAPPTVRWRAGRPADSATGNRPAPVGRPVWGMGRLLRGDRERTGWAEDVPSEIARECPSERERRCVRSGLGRTESAVPMSEAGGVVKTDLCRHRATEVCWRERGSGRAGNDHAVRGGGDALGPAAA
ncbi:Rv3654c family TadE-like protein [Streptomyces sp. NPDC101178]|uniref:Rv3654c family TadE-like protein n=1 Tax=Streptomyces sp. NPDC101178 TaxID=3366124 RepID=UPI0038174A88